MDESTLGAERDGATGLGRRSLIKKAAATGVVAWTAPMVVSSKVSAQASGTLQSMECYKFQFNWWYANPNVVGDVPDNGTAGNLSHNYMLQYNQTVAPAGAWNEECRKSDDDGIHLAGKSVSTVNDLIFKSNQSSVNGQCCKMSYDWWEADSNGNERIKTFPSPGCVLSTPVCGSAGTGDGFANESITFSFSESCSDCYFIDPHLSYATKVPTDGNGAITTSQIGGEYGRTIVINFTGTTLYPVYLKCWIACGPTNSSIIKYVESKCEDGPLPITFRL